MHLLETNAYDRAIPLCDGLDIHAAVGAILDGAVAGSVHVDDPRHPRSVLLRTKHRFYLAGAADNAAFNAEIGAWFDAQVYPEALREGAVEWDLYYNGEPWERAVGAIMAERHPMRSLREYYQYAAPAQGGCPPLPEGMTVRPVDAALLAVTGLRRLDDLREEMCSERASVEEFLARSIGACIVRRDPAAGDELVSWCLSEYDHGDRCEIGIETVEAYRRRGLATVAACTLVERLLARGVTRIGWHCWSSNVPSGATARRVGFERVTEYPVHFAWFDEAANLAVNGNIRLRDGDPEDALSWFRRSLATGRAPNWAFFGAARASAAAGDVGAALGYAGEAIDRGFVHRGAFQGAAELRALRGAAEWKRLMARIGGDGAVESDD